MSTPEVAAEEEPGKVRTWWHPLLASILRWQLASYFSVQDEVLVGKMPFRLDILLRQQSKDDLPELNKKMMAGLLDYFNEVTLLELKSPSDSLTTGDAHALLFHTLLCRRLINPLLDPTKLSVIVLAPAITKPFEEELALLGIVPCQISKGVYQLHGAVYVHRIWLLETKELAGVDHPVLTMVSPQLLEKPQQTYDIMQQAGYETLFVYVAQQIQQFQKMGKEFAMQHHGANDELVEVLRGCLPYMSVEDRLYGLSAEERVKGLPPEERVRGLPPEERLKGLPAEERVKGLPPEERLKGLSREELARLRELLDRSESAE